MARLKSICRVIVDGDWIESKDQSPTGIRLIQTGNIGVGEYLDKSNRAKFISEETFARLKCTQVFPGDILVSRLPDPVGRACIVPKYMKKSIAAVDCTIVRLDDSLCDVNYFINYTQSARYMSELSKFLVGTTRTRISRKNFEKIEIPLPSLDEQCKIAAALDKISDLIAKRRQQLDKLDLLVKSKFVEMFGDPVRNPYGYPKVALAELAEIKIGPFGSLLHKDDYIEGGHPLLNPSHIVGDKINPDDKLTISEQKYMEMSAYHLKTGDVVMGRRGEMGRCAVVPSDGFLCGTGSLIIRTKGEVTADYIQKIISFPSFKKTIEDMAVGQTMPNLNVPIVSKFQIIKPPRSVQDSYYAFLQQADALKQSMQKSLEKLETLKKALMQEYFG